jgi:glycopeptide antibiotics resistance protein
MPSFQINLANVILLIPFGILSPLATWLDHMVVANGNAMFKEFAFHAST